MTTTSPILKLTLVITTLSAFGVPSVGQDARVLSAKKPYVRTGHEATLSGTIRFTGKRPKNVRIVTWADPICHKVNPTLRTEWMVGKKRQLANVLISIKSEMLDAYGFEQRSAPIVLDHRGCRYLPHLLGMRVGQPLLIFNRDPTQHNTHAVAPKNPDWNQSQPPEAGPLEHTFERPDIIAFKCNQHPWEKAYVGVFDHPFFAVSDELGNYRIEGLPPGKYTVVAWHERFGEQTAEITIVPGEGRNLSFTFAAK